MEKNEILLTFNIFNISPNLHNTEVLPHLKRQSNVTIYVCAPWKSRTYVYENMRQKKKLLIWAISL